VALITQSLRFLRSHLWAVWLATVLAIAPAAVLYVGVAGGEMNHSLSQSELHSILVCVSVLEKPGRLLMPGVEYPIFWHSHLQSEFFWKTTIAYFVINFIGWWLVWIVVAAGCSLGRMPFSRRRLR